MNHTAHLNHIRKLVATIVVTAVAATAAACNIPVFRYALERWQPDSCDIVVFHKGALSASDSASVEKLANLSRTGKGAANFNLIRHSVGDDSNLKLQELWQNLNSESRLLSPCVVVRSRVAKGKFVNSWRGTLAEFRPAPLLNSPARQELSRRLLTGGSTVWMVLKSLDQQKNKQVLLLLKKKLAQLQKDMPLPEGIGLPGSELHSEVPLLMKFSVLEVDPLDPKETHLVSLLKRLAPDAAKADEPLVVPIFGRGRVLEVIPGNQVKESLVEDLTVFLCGACSCQVKELNPGFDLLMSTDWTTELFGEDGVEPMDNNSKQQESDGLPVLIPIPAGRAGRSTE